MKTISPYAPFACSSFDNGLGAHARLITHIVICSLGVVIYNIPCQPSQKTLYLGAMLTAQLPHTCALSCADSDTGSIAGYINDVNVESINLIYHLYCT
tara:strand:+ start:1316 stop:1609 length:294 start_codon:yes stop_codon:yes gene_type:complete